MKRIIQFFLLLGFFVYGREALGQKLEPAAYEVVTVEKGMTVSHAALWKTRSAANWKQAWIVVVDDRGRVRTNKQRIQPGWSIWIRADQVKTVSAKKEPLAEICKRYANPDCQTRLAKINQAAADAIFVPKDFTPKAAQAKGNDAKAAKVSESQPGSIPWLALVTIAILAAGAYRLRKTSITLPKVRLPRISNPLAWKNRTAKLERLARKLRARLELSGRTVKNGIEIRPARREIAYSYYGHAFPLDRVFTEMIRDFDDLHGELDINTHETPFQTPRTTFAIRWKRLDRWVFEDINLAELKARMQRDGEKFFDAFKEPIENSVNRDFLGCEISPVPLRDKLIIRLFPKSGGFTPSLRGDNAEYGISKVLKKFPQYHLEKIEQENNHVTITLVLLEESASEYGQAS